MATPSQAGVIGLSSIKVWKLQDGTDITGGSPAYDAVLDLAGAAEMSHDSAASQTPYFADDGLYDVGSTTGFQKITLKLYDVLPQTLAAILGLNYSVGQTGYQNSAVAPYFAVAAKILRNGTSKYENVVFYKVQFMQPKSNWKTKAASINFVEVQLDGAPVALQSLGLTGLRQRSDDTAGDSAALSAWFTTVQLPGANLNALSTVATQTGTGASSKIRFTFAKAGGGSFRINMATITTDSLPIWVAGVRKLGTFTDVTGAAGTTQVVDFTPTVAFAGGELVLASANTAAKDQNGIGCTAYSVQLTLS